MADQSIGVSLKRASDLARSALDVSNSISVSTSVSHSVHSSKTLAIVVSEGNIQFERNISDIAALLSVHFGIRKLIGEANARSGINESLNERERLAKYEKRLVDILNSATQDGNSIEDVVEAQNLLDSISRRLVDGSTDRLYHREDSVVVKIGDLDFVKREISKIQNQRRSIQDTIAGINLNTQITIPSEYVSILQRHGIVD